MDISELIRKLQQRLLSGIAEQFMLEDRSLSARIAQAASAVPRHLFVERYRNWYGEWECVDESNLVTHLPILYRDDPIGISGLPGEEQVATISQPSLVLLMLDLLDLQPGHRVFEVGAGSGWNAALLGELVGPDGYVESVEIISELALRAERAVRALGLGQVRIVSGDACALGPQGATFDRAVFTTGSYDIHEAIFDRVRVGGQLLLVLKFPGGGDVLILFRRELDHFESVTALPCDFVTMTGAGFRRELEPTLLDDFAPWQAVRGELIRERPFTCGGLGSAKFAFRTHALRTFLTIRESRMRWFTEPGGWPHFFFGLWDETSGSFALARNGSLASYGSDIASQALLRHLHDWIELGLPSAVTMKVRAYRAGQAPALDTGERLLRRPATDFVWSESVMNAVDRSRPAPG